MNKRGVAMLLASVVSVVLGSASVVLAQPPTYTVTVLNFSGYGTGARIERPQINNACDVAYGGTNPADGKFSPSIYHAAAIYPWYEYLPLPKKALSGVGMAISPSGLVVGQSAFLVARMIEGQGTSWGGGSPVVIGGTSQSTSVATGVNDAGWVVGLGAYMPKKGWGYTFAGFLWDATTRSLSYLADGSDPVDINAWGQIAGTLGGRVTRWDAGVPTDLGPGYAAAINDAGQVVGWYTTGSDYFAFRTAPNSAVQWPGDSLGVLPGGLRSQAWDINNNGDVVGYSLDPSGRRGFLFTGGAMYDLNDYVVGAPGLVMRQGYSINDYGWIVAGATDASGVGVFVLLIPTS